MLGRSGNRKETQCDWSERSRQEGGSEVGAVAGASAHDAGKPHEAIGFIIRDMECHGGK